MVGWAGMGMGMGMGDGDGMGGWVGGWALDSCRQLCLKWYARAIVLAIATILFQTLEDWAIQDFPIPNAPNLWALHCYKLTLMSQMLCQCYCFPNLQACPQWQNSAGFPNFHFHRILTLQAICPSSQPQNQPKIASTDSCGDFSPEPSSPP